MQDHFQLFGLARKYTLDADALDRAYREMQSRIHPDRHAQEGDAGRRASLQWATRVNEAYRTLKDPVSRARHLLEMRGMNLASETHTAMPPEFLLRQMELRESLDEAKSARDATALDRLREDLRKERQALLGAIAEAFDVRSDDATAAELVRKLMFLEKLDADVRDAFEAIEA